MSPRAAEPSASSLEESFGRRLVLLYNLYTQPFFEQIGRPEGIILPEWLIISTLARHPGIGPSQVSRLTGLHKTTVSRVLSQLCTKGYVKQSADPNDGRGKILDLALAGEQIFTRRAEWAHDWSMLLTGGLSDSEKSTLADMLDRIIENSRQRNG
ncbi:MAG: MarR family transcriptional regulator [Oxalobacteraceae bacterium]|nr:MAG: MarR family transcriptional regulator [Oxalobacteraceae bacterium]